MTLEELYAEVRVKLGNPSTSELSTVAVSYAVEDALAELSRLQPYYTYEDIVITKGVDTYDVSSDIIDIKGFWYTFSRYFPDFDYKDQFVLAGEGLPYNEYAGLKVFHSPSLMNIIEEKWERTSSRSMHTWEYNPDSRELLMIPTPKQEGKGIYKGLMKRDLNNIPEKFISPFKDLVRAYTMETWITSMIMIKSIPVGVGKVDFETRGLERAKNELKKEAIRKLSSGGSAVVIG